MGPLQKERLPECGVDVFWRWDLLGNFIGGILRRNGGWFSKRCLWEGDLIRILWVKGAVEVC